MCWCEYPCLCTHTHTHTEAQVNAILIQVKMLPPLPFGATRAKKKTPPVNVYVCMCSMLVRYVENVLFQSFSASVTYYIISKVCRKCSKLGVPVCLCALLARPLFRTRTRASQLLFRNNFSHFCVCRIFIFNIFNFLLVQCAVYIVLPCVCVCIRVHGYARVVCVHEVLCGYAFSQIACKNSIRLSPKYNNQRARCGNGRDRERERARRSER